MRPPFLSYTNQHCCESSPSSPTSPAMLSLCASIRQACTSLSKRAPSLPPLIYKHTNATPPRVYRPPHLWTSNHHYYLFLVAPKIVAATCYLQSIYPNPPMTGPCGYAARPGYFDCENQRNMDMTLCDSVCPPTPGGGYQQTDKDFVTYIRKMHELLKCQT